MKKITTESTLNVLLIVAIFAACPNSLAASRDKNAVEKAAGTQVTIQGDVMRIGWVREDVAVKVDGMSFPPAAGLGSWAAFKPIGEEQDAIVMGDTVVFPDEVDAAMDAAFAHGVNVTALHNHFFYDKPKVYFMHIEAQGPAAKLAGAVKAVWDAIKAVRAAKPEPAGSFAGTPPEPGGKIDSDLIEGITGLSPSRNPGGVVKISAGQNASMRGTEIGGSMGLTSWAAFTGNDAWAVMDGDFIMTAVEVQPVLKALRKADLHVVALHNHMIGEQPAYFFTHFWGKGTVSDLAKGFKGALEAEEKVGEN